MKPKLVATSLPLNKLHFDDQAYPHFYNPWHFHPEIEITYVVEGYGHRFVGDSMENFNVGDLALIGSKLPHVWKNDSSFYQKNSQRKARAIVVKFLPCFLGEGFWDCKEFSHIKQLLFDRANYGLKIKGNLKRDVIKLLKDMSDMDDSTRIIQTLRILDIVGKSEEYKPLASAAFLHAGQKPQGEAEERRLNRILNFLIKNYHYDMDLSDISEVAYMNRNAFCRFFKQKTGKTIMQMLSEIRVGMACRKLQQTEDNIDVISSTVGFNNLSTFNRTFRLIVGTTPTQYRRGWKKNETLIS